MDIEIQKKIAEVSAYLKNISTESFNEVLLDPIARMMLVALLHEVQDIEDSIKSVAGKITEKYCEDFIPRNEIAAMPALAIVAPRFRKNKVSDAITLTSGVSFVSKHSGAKILTNYIPLFANELLPYDDIYVLTPNRFTSHSNAQDISMDEKNVLWVGINSKAEIETLKNFSIYIDGISSVSPRNISIFSNECHQLDFCTMNRMEDIDMLEPFDAQQSTPVMMSLMRHWRDLLENLHEGMLLYITDSTNDRDVFKGTAYPRVFQNWLESEVLDCFEQNTLWMRIEYPDGVSVPDNCSVIINSVPVVNVDVNTVTLTQTAPIAKLQRQEESFFLQIVETSNHLQEQGFSPIDEEVIIRDYDASCYNNGDLYRDIRNLYNHFIDDYYAFVEYNGLKDGEELRRLKELINRIGKCVGSVNAKYKFDSGTYVMKNINHYPPTMSTRVSFLTTLGARGNGLVPNMIPDKETKLECKKLPVVETYVPVVVGSMGGRDKANADSRYELLRYYSLTNDRLFTKMDVESFVRKELVHHFGAEEYKRINIRIKVEGAAGGTKAQRGLYIDIEFKDKKNYEKAIADNLMQKLHQQILFKSCISMPVIISPINKVNI